MAELTLGLDIGANSLGWALVDEAASRIHAAGVRVFPEGVDRETSGAEVSKNAQRRMARAMRRQIARRARRKFRLRRELVAAGMLPRVALQPAHAHERIAWENDQFRQSDPYTLRARAITGEKLTLFEVGRVLRHLNQRRGFLSNRKTDRGKKKETSELLQEISDLAAAMGERTLGTYLNELRGADPAHYHLTRLRGKHTRRDMFEQEFATIWESQQKNHPQVLTDELRAKLHRTIFFQRPLRAPSPGLIGRCELVSRLPRCARADRRAQRFRLFQEVNNLRVIDMSARIERPLTAAEREKLVKYLRGAKERTFDQIRKHLFEQYENVTFNLERGGRTKLDGMPTDAAMAHKKMLHKAWEPLSEELKDRIVAAIIDDDLERLHSALADARLDPERAADLLENLDLPEGYSSYSLHAIKRLLPHIEKGLPLTSRDHQTPCALREAGFLMPWEHAASRSAFLGDPPAVTNPLVRQALHEVRKVVNAILRELVYKPGHTLKEIRLELAREVRGTAQQRAERTREMRTRESRREDAVDRIRELGHKPTREAIDRYLLWKEQHEVCIYSGRTISLVQLFGGEIDIDHILPYSKSLDNSLMNKVVGFRSENAAKGNRTPYEWIGETAPDRYEQLLQRARVLPYQKLRRCYQKAVELDDFFARQFVDTTYITTQVFDYVRCLGAHVLCPKGQHTAELRRLWGFDTILRDLQDSPAWRAALELPPGEKNRLDHRHHAVDALVIALTSRSRLQQLAKVRRFDGLPDKELDGFKPWPAIRENAGEIVKAINVSHRPRRKVAGALHEETIYGPTQTPGELVVRKELAALTCALVPDIRDPVVREKVIQRLNQYGIDPGRGKDKIPAEVWKEPLWMNEEKRIPIRRVRLVRREKSIRSIRGGTAYVKPGSLHHACIFEIREPSGKTRRDAVYVSMLEAIDRVRLRVPVVQPRHPDFPNAEFLMCVSTGDTLIAEFDGREQIVIVSTLVSTQKRIHIVDANDARPSARKKNEGKTPSSLKGRKVTIDPIGQVRWANDYKNASASG